HVCKNALARAIHSTSGFSVIAVPHCKHRTGTSSPPVRWLVRRSRKHSPVKSGLTDEFTTTVLPKIINAFLLLNNTASIRTMCCCAGVGSKKSRGHQLGSGRCLPPKKRRLAAAERRCGLATTGKCQIVVRTALALLVHD